MRTAALSLVLLASVAAPAADVESRVLTTYLPQDVLEKAVRTEGWTEVPLPVKGGVRTGDVVRLWTGGSIDYGNGDQPGQNIAQPNGPIVTPTAFDAHNLTLSPDPAHAFAVLFKTETPGLHKPPPPGKPLEVTLKKDGERLWLGFNDLRGRYLDNHLGKGRRHELDPFWVRVEVVRIIVD